MTNSISLCSCFLSKVWPSHTSDKSQRLVCDFCCYTFIMLETLATNQGDSFAFLKSVMPASQCLVIDTRMSIRIWNFEFRAKMAPNFVKSPSTAEASKMYRDGHAMAAEPYNTQTWEYSKSCTRECYTTSYCSV